MNSATFKKAVSFFALASVFSISGCQQDMMVEEAANLAVEPTSSSKVIPGKFIVILKDKKGQSVSELRERILGRNGMEIGRAREMFQGALNGFSGSFSKEEINLLRADLNVAFIEPEQAVSLGKTATSSTVTTTTTTSTQVIPWGVARVGYGDGTGKTVWVIDSGVQTNHPDLNVDMVRSKSFISGDASFEDGYGHGTGVAGVIGAKDNNEGVVGVAANATIVALRVFDNTGYGTLTRIYSAMNYVFQNAQPGDVVNMSLRVAASSMLDDLVKKTAARGIFIAVASGNSYIDCKVDSPARIIAPNVYVVSNMNSYGSFNPTSNFGASVNFTAPGTDIRTTWKGSGYATGNGTSYAAPHVAGILAVNGGIVNSQGFVTNDPDGTPDPIAMK
ncbi:S8 family serine peptidase [Rufibacter sediminis]|uniref:S8 family serine peptidase n=1 Tax=Rufibacter sediminis TaxID=2762756 RepID=A0ABR6W000_9BACT|nr:S8 family serine peptidase [Rufibacter sediminis]MBC3542377.1 S8 family serine peptidase [Rufibacter sediminis]